MIISVGTKVHVVERRLFESDVRRHFIGEVMASSDQAMQVRGWVFVYDGSTASFRRQPERRTRIVTLVDARIIVNILPEEAMIERAEYRSDENGNLTVTDGEAFSLAMNEFGFRR